MLQLTDPHLFADLSGELRGVVTYSSLRRVVSHYQASRWPADLVALTGDVIQDDSADAYGHCREVLSGIGLPILCVPGNHDVRSLMRNELGQPPFVYCGSHEWRNWLLVGVDSCAAGRAGGAIGKAELERVAAVIEGSGAEHVLVYLHHPLVPMHSAWLDTVGLDNAEQFLAMLSGTGRVRMAIFGHVHQEYDRVHDGIRVVATPSTCRQFKPRAVEFAVDDNPPAYRRIGLAESGAIETEVVWVSDE